MPDTPQLGPVSLCTLITRDGQALMDAYAGWLHQQPVETGPLDPETASAIGHPALAGAPSWLLANLAGRRWLHIVEHHEAVARDSLHSHGWLAMEVLVADVDTLAAGLADSPFEILRPPADLDVSDRIRACQVRGPAGEVLYLTQVSGEVPPFELPICEAPVDHLFIPVLCTPSRANSLATYSNISGNSGICFDTKITVLNQARGIDLQQRHPVATLQLAGRTLIEVDEIAHTNAPPAGICNGMANVAFTCSTPAPTTASRATAGPFAGQLVSSHTGCAGEHFTLVHS